MNGNILSSTEASSTSIRDQGSLMFIRNVRSDNMDSRSLVSNTNPVAVPTQAAYGRTRNASATSSYAVSGSSRKSGSSLPSEHHMETSHSRSYLRIKPTSRSTTITLEGSPFIRLMPKITAVAGNDLVIKCPVAGYPIESITWERDGSILPINRRQRVYNNGTLIIEQAQRGTDAGTYTCQAQNRQKHTSRRDVQVEILLPPKILPIQALTNVLREGMRAAISCQVLEGDLPLSFQWQRNDKDDLGFGVAVRRLDEYSSSLVIEKVESSHSANYTCIAQNIAGSESFTVPLTVNVPPRWTMEPSDTNVVLGFDVMLHCQAEGYPEPTILWRKAPIGCLDAVEEEAGEPSRQFLREWTLEEEEKQNVVEEDDREESSSNERSEEGRPVDIEEMEDIVNDKKGGRLYGRRGPLDCTKLSAASAGGAMSR
nr:Down syndrome cell adhesion molecule-like protein Dscam2 [Halyomorpha halys]